jgi:transposase
MRRPIIHSLVATAFSLLVLATGCATIAPPAVDVPATTETPPAGVERP